MRFISSILLALLFNAPLAHAAQDDIVLVGNSEVSATLRAQGKRVTVGGRLSASLLSSPSELKRGMVRVEDLNVLLRRVQQSLLSNRTSKVAELGSIGIALNKTVAQTLKYDAIQLTLEGDLTAFADFSQMGELVKPRGIRGKEDDVYTLPVQKTRIHVKMKLNEPLGITPGDSRAHKVSGDLSAEIAVDDLPALRFNRYDLIIGSRFTIDYGIIGRFRAGSRLCLQPVSIRSGKGDASPTGAGLAFGMPGANTQWAKAGVVFNVRPRKTVINSALKIASEGDEETTIRSTVNDDDCIEIFFVQNFSPESLHGGGATWGSGTSGAKIISSDGNATFGVDLTHLAHELGHVLSLAHPGSGLPSADRPNMFDGTTGTLMCPSGWHNDNPPINSVDNQEKRTNPLLVYTLMFSSRSSDCTDDADCGACH